MGKVDLPFQYGELQAMGGLLESMNALIKDSDAKEEKEAVKKFLREATDTLQFVIVGDAEVGKTSLLAGLFGDAVLEGREGSPTVGVIEFQYGEEHAEIEIGEGKRRVFCPEEVLRGISVIDTQGFGAKAGPLSRETVRSCLEKSDVLIAAFQADNPGSFEMWDMLEGVEAKKTVFVMTKTDLSSGEEMEKNEDKVRRYMAESGIEAPIFRVCLRSSGEVADREFQDFRDYINKNVIGGSARLKKQMQNLRELKGILQEASDSFELRKKQYEADREVLENINRAMDTFQIGSRERIDRLKQDLRGEVYAAVEAYEQEIIARLNPRQIKERFPKGYSDFVDYLNYINEGYRKKMTNEVDRKTKEAVRAYLSELENVFEEATGYIRERESLIKLEDKFYGSMAKDRQEITAKAGHDLQETKAFYGRLTQASEDLFMKIWQERETYEKKTGRATMTGGVAGAAAGAGVVYGVAALANIGAAAATGTTMLSAAAAGVASVGVLVPIAAAILGAVIIASMAKKIASAKNMQEMEQRVQEAIAEFRQETAVTKNQITEQIFETVESIFRREITGADKTFADFRMAVNIDGKNIPMLENRMQDIHAFLEKIEEAERERLLR